MIKEIREGTESLWRRVVLICVAVAIAIGGTVVVMQVAKAAPHVIFDINSLDMAGDSDTADGICATANVTGPYSTNNPECTLRAAIEQANALSNVPGKPAVGEKDMRTLIKVDPDFAGGVIWLPEVGNNTGNSYKMNTNHLRVITGPGGGSGSVSEDYGAFFEMTQPVVIDLGGDPTTDGFTPGSIELRPKGNTQGSSDGADDFTYAALFYVNGTGVQLQNIKNSWSSETTFYVGPNAIDTIISDVRVDTPDYYAERFVLIRGGSTNTVIRNSWVSGFAAGEDDYGWGVVDGAQLPTNKVNGLTLEGNTYHTHNGGTTACGGTTADGCNTAILRASGQNGSGAQHIDNLVIKGNTSENLNHQVTFNASMLDLAGVTANNITIINNKALDAINQGGMPHFNLRNVKVSGTVKITNNNVGDVSGTGYGAPHYGDSSWLDITGATIADLQVLSNKAKGAEFNSTSCRIKGDSTSTVLTKVKISGNEMIKADTTGNLGVLFTGQSAWVNFQRAVIGELLIEKNAISGDATGVVFTTGASGAWLQTDSAQIGTIDIKDNEITKPSLAGTAKALIDLNMATGGANHSAATRGSFTITGNKITGVSTTFNEEVRGVIYLPLNKGVPSGEISGNVMTAETVGIGAIYWRSRGGELEAYSKDPSGVVIEDNHFDGFGDNTWYGTIRLAATGAVTVRRNTFGTQTQNPASGKLAQSVIEENSAGNGFSSRSWNAMVTNWSLGANGNMNTWYPAVNLSQPQPPTTTLASTGTQDGHISPVGGCSIPLEVNSPSYSTNGADITNARYPTLPVTLDVYWTKLNTAEVFLGSYTVGLDAPATENPDPKYAQAKVTDPGITLNTGVNSNGGSPVTYPGYSTTLNVPLPYNLQDGAHKTQLARLLDESGQPLSVADLPVNPTNGQVSGYLRVQTQDPNANGVTMADTTGAILSSQYSRVAKIGGECTPYMTITRSPTHYTVPGTSDITTTTKNRYVHFTLDSRDSNVDLDLSPAKLLQIKQGIIVNGGEQDPFLARTDDDYIVVSRVGKDDCKLRTDGCVEDPRRIDIAVKVNDTGKVTVTINPGVVVTAGSASQAAGQMVFDRTETTTGWISSTPSPSKTRSSRWCWAMPMPRNTQSMWTTRRPRTRLR